MSETQANEADHGGATAAAPTRAAERIEALDVLRGFALLGILLLNILGMGMHSAAYFYPGMGATGQPAVALDFLVFGTTDLFFEGAMRALFSMLFGAGIVLFTTGLRAKSGALHYRRTFWLLAFGLLDAYLLLWNGDILVVYALAGFLLYPARNASPRRLFIAAGVLLALIAALHTISYAGISGARAIHERIEAGETVSEQDREFATAWTDFRADNVPEQAAIAEELKARSDSYASAFAWNAPKFTEILLFVVPLFLLWDAVAMMLIGMALYKLGVLSAQRSKGFYRRLALAGFGLGLAVNLTEAWRAYQANYDVLAVFGYLQPSYDLGRLGLALGYLALVMLICKANWWPALRARLAAVGRLALTNYLMHSLIALILFTGAGFGLIGQVERPALYPIVFAIWALQLWFSPWWLARRRFGPVEWLWRTLTYGRRPGA